MSRRTPGRTLIDGFNLFHRWSRTRELFCEDRDIGVLISTALSRLLPILWRMPGSYAVVLDGGREARTERRGPVTIIHAGPGRTADAAILELVRASSRPHDIAIVTSDRPLGGGTRALGAHPVTVEDFLARIAALPPEEAPIPQKYTPPPPEEVAEFLAIFGDGAEAPEGEGETP